MNNNDDQSKKTQLFDTHLFDQVQTAVEQMAEIVSNYYLSLIKQGVPPEIASELTKSYQTSILSMGKGGNQ